MAQYQSWCTVYINDPPDSLSSEVKLFADDILNITDNRQQPQEDLMSTPRMRETVEHGIQPEQVRVPEVQPEKGVAYQKRVHPLQSHDAQSNWDKVSRCQTRITLRWNDNTSHITTAKASSRPSYIRGRRTMLPRLTYNSPVPF